MNEKEDKILNEYYNCLILKDFEKDTINRYMLSVKKYFIFLELNNIDYEKTSIGLAEDYRTYLVASKVMSRGSVNNELNRLRNFYSFLVKREYIYKNPFKEVSNLKQVSHLVKNILSIEDMGKLLDNFSVKSDYDLLLKSMAEIMYGSALRISEAVKLKLDDVDYEERTLNIIQSKTKGERRKIMTNDIALNVLKKYLKYSRPKLLKTGDEEYIYPQIEIESYVVSLNRKLNNECKRLGLKIITSHGIRHSAATHLMKKGAGVRLVQSFLGHKKLTSTQVYTHVFKDDLKNVVEKYHPRG